MVSLRRSPSPLLEPFRPANSEIRGVPGSFTFTPVMPVVEYEYFFSDGAFGTVQANPDGTAAVTWTPIFSGWHVVYVWGYTSTGDQTGLTIYSFWVNDSA